MFVGARVFVRMMVECIRSLMSIETKFVRRATWAGGEGHRMEATWHRKGRAEHTGHQLVSRVRVDGCAIRVSVVVSPAVVCGKSENVLRILYQT